jgi:hypothetical protein
MEGTKVSADVNAAAADLIACLKRQAEQLRGFMELLARQRQALVERDSEGLERIVAQQERAIAQSRQLEQQRQALTAHLARLGRKADASPTLAGIAELVRASDASRLTQMQELLSGLQKEIDRRRSLNAGLIEQSLRCTSETLQWIARRMRPQAVYGARQDQSATGMGQIAVNRRC